MFLDCILVVAPAKFEKIGIFGDKKNGQSTAASLFQGLSISGRILEGKPGQKGVHLLPKTLGMTIFSLLDRLRYM